jgi:drug/metabolite transporter (DMT)-like permease
MQLYYFWPALAAFTYAVGAILTKRALAEGSGVVRFTFACNLAFLVTFLLPALVASEPFAWSQIGWPILGGISFFLGQVLTIGAIRVGDVSIQSPLMGSKVVFVALIGTFFGSEKVQPTWWVGAGLAALAVFLLGFSNWKQSRSTWLAVGMAIGASAIYAVSDVLVATKAGHFGVRNYLAAVMVVQFILSTALIPLFRQPMSAIPRSAWKWVLIASLMMSTQAILMNISLGYYPYPTAFNVIFSTRGLWSVLLVWWFGSLVGNRELAAGSGLVIRRLLGAGLLLAAVGLVLSSS